MITVEEFMTSNPYTLRDTDRVSDAWQVMTDKNIHHIPVTDKNNQLVGLVSQRDVLAATGSSSAEQGNVAGQDIQLSEIMTRKVKVIRKEEPLREAAIYMQSHKFGCMPVISDNGLIGIITDSDFVTIAINLLEQADLAEEDFGQADLDEEDFGMNDALDEF